MTRSFMSCNGKRQLILLLSALLSFIFATGQNPIVTENALTGNPASEWDISGAGSTAIQGFATDISVNRGTRVNFKINTSSAFTYTIKIYRIGYYQGNGARLIADRGTFTGTVQPAPFSDGQTGLVDCGNWSISAFWDVPATAVSGVYIAKLARTGAPSTSSHIVFIVRDDASTSDLFFQTSDATWQAYNNYGGNSLYVGATSYPNGHATKVSYNRPFLTRAGGGGGGAMMDWLFNAEYPMIRFLERNGYNVSYTTNVDAARRGNLILNHKIFLSVGHDEYWSAEQRTNVESARNAGVHLCFFSGNEVYWKTRWENSADGSNTAYRTLVCYKDGTLGENQCGTKCDPNTAWTGLWRDGCSYPGSGGCKPENALTGQISWRETSGPITVPAAYKSLRFWRGTAVAGLGNNQTATLTDGALGYEWDQDQYPDSYPSGRIILSNTNVNGDIHKLSLYRQPGGGLVFGAGTVQWSWGLDNVHDRGNPAVSKDMQQATVNLFADMGSQPGSLMSGLTVASASTDVTAPQVTITNPLHNGTVTNGATITITGTATDAGGVVAGIEISIDGGLTWKLATGTTNWSYTWTPLVSGTNNIRVRGFDDSGNMGVPGAAGSSSNINVTVSGGSTPNCTNCTIFQSSSVPASLVRENDGQSLELGVKFQSSQNGFITGIRFYKANGVTGTHTGSLWTRTGTRLAQATFINETANGWQEVLFATPVAINAGTTYVASYFSTSGDYIGSNPFFATATSNPPLRALASGEDGGNGLYQYSATSIFPSSSYQTSNYWVDVVYSPGADNIPPSVASVIPLNAATNVAINSTVTANFTEGMNAGTLTAANVQLKAGATVITATLNVTATQVVLTPSAPLANNTVYTVTIKGGASGVKDLAGNALANDFNWSFTTIAADLTPPTVTAASPANGSTNVNIGTNVSVTFSEAMNLSTINQSRATLKDAGGNLVAVTLNLSSNSVTLVPFAPLEFSTVYTITITGGTNGVKDLAGNSLASDFNASFTTVATDLTPPTVTTVSPVNGATGIGTSATVTVNFSEAMNMTTLTGTTVQLKNGATVIPAALNVGSTQVVITPSAALASSTLYTVTVTGGASGVKDVAGNALAANFTSSFTTVIPPPPPSNIFQSSTVPASIARENDFSAIEFGMKFRSTVAGNITGVRFYKATGTTGTHSGSLWSSTGTRLAQATFTETASGWQDVTFTTPVAITANTTYVVSVFSSSGDYVSSNPYFTAAVVNGTLRALANGEDGPNGLYIFSGASSFPTSNYQSSNYWVDVTFASTVDNAPPTVTGVTPANGAANVAINTTVTTTFSEAMNTSTVNGTTVQLKNGATVVPAALNVTSTQVTLTPTAALNNSTTYTVTITGGASGVKDAAGNALVSDFGWSFTTVAPPDITPPTVTTVVPANSATGVAVNTTVTAGFSEAMNTSTITGTTVQLKNGATVIPATLNVTSTQVTLTPSAALSYSTLYTVTITGGVSGVKDIAGNALASNFTSSFTTAAPPDVTPPSITVASPVNGATGVAINATLTADFSESINTSTATAATVQLKNGATVIPATLNVTATQVTLTPSAALSYTTLYTVTITGGVNGVKDLAGNPLASDYSWSFTTRNPPDITPPTIVNQTPASGAIGVPLNTTVVLNYSEPMQIELYGQAALQLADNTPVNTTVNIVSSSQVILTPTAPLQSSTTYTVFTDRTITDMAGNQLQGPFFWTFTTAATVSSVTPLNGATGVSNTPVVTVNFAKAMDALTITGTTVQLKNGATVIPATLELNSTQMTLTPSAPLDNLTLYTVTITGGSPGVKDIDGNPLAADYSWSFTTAEGSDVTPPVVSILSPANNATGVQINATASASFSEAMDVSTITETTVQLKNGATVIPATLNVSSTQVTLTPASPLSYLTVYTVTITGGANGVKDIAGNAPANDFSWSFTTRDAPDVTPPTVTTVSPVHGSKGVPVNTTIVASFSEPMDAISLDMISMETGGGTPIAGMPVASSSQVTFTPLAPLANSTVYVVTIDRGVKDVAGNIMGAHYSWSFSTAAAVTSVTPANGATGVSINTIITANFNTAINPSTVTETTVQLKNGTTVIPAVLAVNGVQLTLTPSAPLDNSAVYTVTITGGENGVKDAAGNAIAADYAWSFTAVAFDITPPTVTTVIPVNGATNVALNATVTANFSEAMTASTVTGATVQLKNGTTVIPATLNVSATQVVLTPSAALSYSTVYTVTITGGINGVKDAAGNPLAGDYSWNFTTVPPPDVTPPTVTSTSPVSGATGVGINVVITANFSEPVTGQEAVTLTNASGTPISAMAEPISSTQVRITPTASLAYGVVYTVTIDRGVVDTHGNIMGTNYSWSFTTANQPAVTTVAPVNGATSVAINTTVTANFNQAMNVATITGTTVQLRAGSTVIPAALNVISTQLTLTPSSPLANSTVYTVTITGGASGVKDAAGGSLASDYSWSFTTVAVPPVTIFQSSTAPSALPVENDGSAIELGVKFRSAQSGYITGIRFYKKTGVTGSHTGSLWTSTGTRLAQATFINETASGWQDVSFANPVAITANTTYVASYFSSSGDYTGTNPFFTSATVNSPLRALANGEDGPNGLYRYTATSAFPDANWQSVNYWVDVVYIASLGPDVTPPTVLSVTPPNGSVDIGAGTTVTATFTEAISAASVTSASVILKDAANNTIAATLNTTSGVVTLTPTAALSSSTVYTVTIKGGISGVKDVAGNALAADYTWSFTTAVPPTPLVVEGTGGPIMVLGSTTNQFSRYTGEILRAEGLNGFLTKDIAQVTAAELNNYDVVILGEIPVTAAQVTMLTDWVTAGGTLIAFKPANALAPLLGISNAGGTLVDKYLLVNTSSGPGAGIVNQTIQYHGTANLHTLNGATSLATLYSTATAATANPAVTSRSVGVSGGKAIAFTYDLARSVVYTRQGNPAWAGQERDGQAPVRSDDMFFGSPNWIDFTKVAIPQADEQQRLLANIIIQNNLHRKPLPRFWYLPKGLKAAIVMTGDDHANNGTPGRFDQYLGMGPNTAQDVADWNAVRGTSYVYPNTAMTNAQAISYQAQGFEIALHPTTDCINYTFTSLTDTFTHQLAKFRTKFPGINNPVTNRTHCLIWSDWASQALVELQNGQRFDVTYYNWPESWMQNIPGMFTGSGIPMRFANMDGSIIDVYQATTQITDETNIPDYGAFTSALLDKAIGPEGYYGVFTANMHTDYADHAGSDAIIASAQARQIPVVSARQMLNWLDGRNTSSFGPLTWSNYQLSFTITATAGARNMKTMLPVNTEDAVLGSITRNGSAVTFTTQTIKGILYAFFDAAAGTNSYVATYISSTAAPIVTLDPVAKTICQGSSVTFTTTATGGPAPTVQWQVTTNGTSWSNLAGATNATLTFTPVAADNNKQYRAIWTNSQGADTTNAAALAVNAIPAAPGITVANNCGNSLLTATGVTGTLLWSNGATAPSITVTNAATYTVTQTTNGCVSAAGSGTSAPVATPAAPTVSVTGSLTFCQGGSVTLTSSSASGNTWSNGATTQSIVVTTAGSYTVTFTNTGGCTSAPSAARVVVVNAQPSLTSSLAPTVVSGDNFAYTATSSVAGTTFSWSRAAVAGISNAASTGTGNVSQILVNTTDAPVNVTYVYTLTANGCSRVQNVVVTVSPRPVVCAINGSITTTFNSSTIPSGRYIWFNAAFDPGTLGTTGAVNFYVTNNVVTFTANNVQHTINLPNSKIRFDANVTSATTTFVNNRWETVAPLAFNNYVFLGGHAYQVPASLPGNISNAVWSCKISIDRPSTSLTWRWSAATYSLFTTNSGINVKPVNGNTQNPYNNNDNAGAPQNTLYRVAVVSGAKTTGGTNYTGTYSNTSTATCSTGALRGVVEEEPQPLITFNRNANLRETVDGLQVRMTPNPTSTHFTAIIRSNTNAPVTIRIIDAVGRVVERHDKLPGNTVLQLGNQLKGGSYFAEIVQGEEKKVVKLVKMN